MEEKEVKKVKIVLDTNILISALGFGGNPRKILGLVLEKRYKAITSAVLLAELEDVITKKFPKLAHNLERINKQIRKNVKLVKPKTSIHILQDEPDNRVLEAAIEGKCDYIITGDKKLLDLKVFRGIKILKANEFISVFDKN